MISIYAVETIQSQNRTLQITDSLNEKNTKCFFLTQGEVLEWDEISIETLYGQTLFAGVANKPGIDKTDGVTVRTVEVLGYKKIFDRLNVGKAYAAGTDAGDIIKDIITNFAPGFGGDFSFIEDGPAMGKVIFNWILPSEAINRLAKAAGYDWYIDFQKRVHFTARESVTAAKNVTETSNFHKNFKFDIDLSNFCNQVVVRGGTYQTDLQTFEEVGDGVKTQFLLPDKPQDITVYVDTGAGYVEKTLGIKFEGETPTTEFVVNYQEAYIENGTHAVLTDPDKIKVTYKYQAPVRVKVQNLQSITATKAKFPELAPDGVIEKVIDDAKIDSRELAYDLAQAELDAYSNPVISGAFITYDPTFSRGEMLEIAVNEYTGSAVIQQVISKNEGGTLWRHAVSFSTVLYDFEDFMRELFAARKIELITNEVVESLYNFYDSVSISDTVTISTDENRKTDTLTASDDMYDALNQSVTHVLGPYFPSGYADPLRSFLLDTSPLT